MAEGSVPLSVELAHINERASVLKPDEVSSGFAVEVLAGLSALGERTSLYAADAIVNMDPAGLSERQRELALTFLARVARNFNVNLTSGEPNGQ